MKHNITPTLLVSSILLTSSPLYAALRWNPSSGTYDGGGLAGGSVSSAFQPGTATGYSGMCLDPSNPHTFRTIAGTDVGLCHDLGFTDSNGAPVLVRNLKSDGVNICFDLFNPLAAGETLNLTFDFNTPIGTWETPGNVSPLTGSNAQFATSFRTTDLVTDPNDTTYNDITYGFTNSSAPAAPVGGTPGPWDYSNTAGPFLADPINPNGGTASTRTISGPNNEFVDFDFVNGPGDGSGMAGIQFQAAVRDNNDGPNADNFTSSFSWSVTAGAAGLDAGTTFKLTIDGTPLGPVPVPEPSRAVLLLLGVASVSCFRRRR